MEKLTPETPVQGKFNITLCVAISCFAKFVTSKIRQNYEGDFTGMNDVKFDESYFEVELFDVDLATILKDLLAHNIVADLELNPIAERDFYATMIEFNIHTRIENGQAIAYKCSKSDENISYEMQLLKKSLNEKGIFAANEQINSIIDKCYSIGWVTDGFQAELEATNA